MRQEFAQLLRRELDQSSNATLAAAGDQTREWLANCVAALEEQRVEESQKLYANFERLQSQRLADYLQLKKDVDTVAVNTDAGLRQLASLNQPADHPKQP